MTVLQVKSLCVKDVVHDVAFSIAPGERVGLIGGAKPSRRCR